MTPDRTEWLKERRKGIGGSDVAALFGLSKWKSALDIYNDKVSTDDPVDEQNDVLALASYLEEYTAQKYAELVGLSVRRKNIPLVHCDYSFIRGNIDREICNDENKGIGILECKAVSTYNFKAIEMRGLPDEYILQMQQYFLSGNGRYKWGAFAILNRDNGKLLTFIVYPDAVLMEEIKAKEIDFWQNHVEKRIPPAENVSAEPKEKIPEYNGTVEDMRNDETLNDLIAKLAEYTSMQSDAEKLVEATKDLIAERLGDKEAVECIGARIFFKASTRKSLDSTKLKKELPDVYAKYEKETTTKRSLRVYNINNQGA